MGTSMSESELVRAKRKLLTEEINKDSLPPEFQKYYRYKAQFMRKKKGTISQKEKQKLIEKEFQKHFSNLPLSLDRIKERSLEYLPSEIPSIQYHDDLLNYIDEERQNKRRESDQEEIEKKRDEQNVRNEGFPVELQPIQMQQAPFIIQSLPEKSNISQNIVKSKLQESVKNSPNSFSKSKYQKQGHQQISNAGESVRSRLNLFQDDLPDNKTIQSHKKSNHELSDIILKKCMYVTGYAKKEFSDRSQTKNCFEVGSQKEKPLTSSEQWKTIPIEKQDAIVQDNYFFHPNQLSNISEINKKKRKKKDSKQLNSFAQCLQIQEESQQRSQLEFDFEIEDIQKVQAKSYMESKKNQQQFGTMTSGQIYGSKKKYSNVVLPINSKLSKILGCQSISNKQGNLGSTNNNTYNSTVNILQSMELNSENFSKWNEVYNSKVCLERPRKLLYF